MHLRNFILAATAILLTACHDTGRTLTSATGTIYECLVVINPTNLEPDQKAALQQRKLAAGSAYEEDVVTTYDLIRAVMEAEMPCLPQMEPYFKLTQVKTSAFDAFLMPTRNILYVDIDPAKYTQTKAKVATDQWSHPQAVYRIQAPDEESFVAYWLEHGVEVREWFVRQELARQTTFYRASTNKQARAALDRQLGCDMWIPEDYMLIMDTTFALSAETASATEPACHLIWCCNSKGSMRRDIIVYAYPYEDANTFTADYLNHQRDAILGRLITASVPGSYMGTEYKVFPPQMRQISKLPTGKKSIAPDFYGMEIRGLWKIYDGEAMGGPYVSHTRVDEINHRVITAETFLFASGQKKRNELRKAEAVLYTLELPQERNAVEEVTISNH